MCVYVCVRNKSEWIGDYKGDGMLPLALLLSPLSVCDLFDSALYEQSLKTSKSGEERGERGGREEEEERG